MVTAVAASFSDILASEFSLLRQRLVAQHELHIHAVHLENRDLKRRLDEKSFAPHGQSIEDLQPPSVSAPLDMEFAGISTTASSSSDQKARLVCADLDTTIAMYGNGNGSVERDEHKFQDSEPYTDRGAGFMKAAESDLFQKALTNLRGSTDVGRASQAIRTRDTAFKRLETRQNDGKYGDNRIAELSRAIVEWQLHSRVSVEQGAFLEFQEGSSWKDKLDIFVQRVVRWKGFDNVMGVIILLNSITIGLEIEADGDGSSDVAVLASKLEHIFLSLYILEICLRLRVEGMSCLSDNWVRFDILIMSIGILSLWVLPLVLSLASVGGSKEAVTVLETIIVMRVLRLLRLVRAFRMMKHFRISWRLVDGLLSSSWAMMSALALLILCLYVFACAGLELIHLSAKDDLDQHIALYFPSLPMTMLTLFRFVTLDSPSTVYGPIVVEEPLMAIYFVCIVLVVSIALMNLVTAVLVEASIAGANKDKELKNTLRKQKCKMLAPVLRKAFRTLDSDASGGITRDEVAQSGHHLPDLLKSVLEHYSVTEIFDIIDMDGTGTLEETEFVEGLIHMATSDLDPGMLQMFSLIRLQRRDMAALDFLVTEMAVNLRTLCKSVKRSGEHSHHKHEEVEAALHKAISQEHPLCSI